MDYTKVGELMFNLDSFITKYVTKRPQSMFLDDIERNKNELSFKIKGKRAFRPEQLLLKKR